MTSPRKFIPAFLSWLDDANEAHSLYFDLCMSYTPEHSSEITTHPVEQGANIADNVRVKPLQLKLEVFTSNTPIDDYPDGSRQAKVVSTTLSYPTAVASAYGPKTINNYQFGGANPDYIKATYDQLVALHDAHTLLSVTTPIKPYTNMIIVDLKMPRDDQASGDAAKFSIELEQITIVSSDIVDTAIIPQAKPQETIGQGDPEPTDGQDAPRESVAAWLGDQFGL